MATNPPPGGSPRVPYPPVLQVYVPLSSRPREPPHPSRPNIQKCPADPLRDEQEVEPHDIPTCSANSLEYPRSWMASSRCHTTLRSSGVINHPRGVGGIWTWTVWGRLGMESRPSSDDQTIDNELAEANSRVSFTRSLILVNSPVRE